MIDKLDKLEKLVRVEDSGEVFNICLKLTEKDSFFYNGNVIVYKYLVRDEDYLFYSSGELEVNKYDDDGYKNAFIEALDRHLKYKSDLAREKEIEFNSKESYQKWDGTIDLSSNKDFKF